MCPILTSILKRETYEFIGQKMVQIMLTDITWPSKGEILLFNKKLTEKAKLSKKG